MIFTRAGFKALKFTYAVLIAGLAVSGFIVAGSYLYWQSEKKNDQQSQRALTDMRSRLNAAMRDREDLRGSKDTYKALVSRGVFIAEDRFDLIEALAALKTRHQLVALTYEISPQRPLRLANGSSYAGVEILASQVKMKILALHDGDLIAFLDEFPRLQRGFFPLDRCVIKRIAEAQAAPVVPVLPVNDEVASAVTPAVRPTLAARLEAECALEWVTLRAKTNTAAPAIASAAGTRPL